MRVNNSRSDTTIITALALAVPLVVIIVLLWYSQQREKTEDIRSMRRERFNNLFEIGQALKSYHEAFGSYPPATLRNGKGQPTFSWRVSLLPHLERVDVYKRYDKAKPWNAAENRAIEAMIPSFYRSPLDKQLRSTQEHATSYLAVVRTPGVASHQDTRRNDRRNDSIALIVEACNANVHWMDPTDFYDADLSTRINDNRPAAIASGHKDGAMVLTPEGRVFFLPTNIDSRIVGALVTGRETGIDTVDALVVGLSHADADIREVCAWLVASGDFDFVSHTSQLISLMSDRSRPTEVRVACVEALSSIDRPSSEVLDAIRAASRDDGTVVSTHARDAVVNLDLKKRDK